MRTLEDINYEYIQTELVVKFFMEKLEKLDKEHEETFQREQQLIENAKNIKREGRRFHFIKGIRQD